MTIDIKPNIKLATDTAINLALKVYDKPLYCVEKEDGTQFSATFNPEQLENFCPSKTVSEMLTSWETSTTGKLSFIKYTHDPELKVFPMLGNLIPAIAKRDIFDLCKKGEKVHLQSILYNKPTLLANAMGVMVDKNGDHFGMCRWIGSDDDPIGTIKQQLGSSYFVHKAFDAVIAPIGSFHSLTLITKKGTYPISLLGFTPISKLFEKID